MKRTIILISIFLGFVLCLIAWNGEVEKESEKKWGFDKESGFTTEEKEEDDISLDDGEEILKEARESLEKGAAIDGYLAANYNYEKYNSDIYEDELIGTKIYIEGTVIKQGGLDVGDEKAFVLDVELEDGNHWFVAFFAENRLNNIEGKYIRAFGEYIGIDEAGIPILAAFDTTGEPRAKIQEKEHEIGFKTIYDPQEYFSGQQKEQEAEEVVENTNENVEEQNVYVPTLGESNALKSAKSYISYMAFSYTGLIEQLEYEKYTHEEAVYGADNCGADWNEQAAKSAASYLEYMSFSRDGLIEQLEYEGFTHEQAVYGASQNGY